MFCLIIVLKSGHCQIKRPTQIMPCFCVAEGLNTGIMQVEKTPAIIKEGLSKSDAEDLQKKIEAGRFPPYYLDRLDAAPICACPHLFAVVVIHVGTQTAFPKPRPCSFYVAW